MDCASVKKSFGLLALGVLVACQGPARTASVTTGGDDATPSPEPTATVGPQNAPTAALLGCNRAEAVDSEIPGAYIMVCPDRGPVGAVVEVQGRGCTYPRARTYLVFGTESQTSGTAGYGHIGEIPSDEATAFKISYKIPSDLEPIQSRLGGGPTRPGTYWFFSKPPVCNVEFVVTSS